MTEFVKYHGLGNDFVVVERETKELAPGVARSMCDRRRGIGADGVLVVSPAEGEGAAAAMTLYNRDGTRPEMCGNGIRCVVRHLVERRSPSASDRDWPIETDAGIRTCRVVEASEGSWRVEVDMGPGEVLERNLEFEVGGEARTFSAVDLGNPHAVSFGAVTPEIAEAFGRYLNAEASGAFPEGVNVEFVRQHSATELEVVVYERGVGRTEACGTGACAAAVAAWDHGEVREGAEIDVHLPGGVLQIRRASGGDVWMTGPVVAVFEGEWIDEI